MIRWPLILFAFLACANRAYAEPYGPPAPEVVLAAPDSDQRAKDLQWQRDTKSAWTKFWISQGLAATDVALTCAILAKGGHEVNPIYGRGASCGKIAGIRAGIGVLQYFIARRRISEEPHRTSKEFNVVVGIQGIPVIWNAVQLAR